MDWYVSGGISGVRPLCRQIRDYLQRHAEPGSAVDDAQLVVTELLTNAVEHASGPVWVRLSWHAEEPDVEVWDLGPGFALPHGGTSPAAPVEHVDTSSEAAAPYPELLPDAAAEGGRGLFLVTHLAPVIVAHARRGGGTHVSARLPVRRAPSPTFEALSQAVEHTAGPQVIEQVVSEVGVGGRRPDGDGVPPGAPADGATDAGGDGGVLRPSPCGPRRRCAG